MRLPSTTRPLDLHEFKIQAARAGNTLVVRVMAYRQMPDGTERQIEVASLERATDDGSANYDLLDWQRETVEAFYDALFGAARLHEDTA